MIEIVHKTGALASWQIGSREEAIAAALAFQGEIVGEILDEETGERYPIHRFQGGTIRKVTSAAIEAMPHWAGESVGDVKKVQPAAEIVQELVSDAEKLLRPWF